LNKFEEQWQENYKLAKQFYEEKGNLLIPVDYIKNNIKLGIWIKNQRKKYKENKLSQEKIDLLNQIGMIWKIDKNNQIIKERRTKAIKKDEQWMENYQLAKQYYSENGNLLISIDYEMNNKKLGIWISYQRGRFNGTRFPFLTQTEIDLLNEIEMVWDVYEAQWKSTYNLVKKYYENNNNLKMPKNYKINNVNLYTWILIQRKLYKQNKLSQEKINLLETIGMVWNVK
jgi:hypothetical protein